MHLNAFLLIKKPKITPEEVESIKQGKMAPTHKKVKEWEPAWNSGGGFFGKTPTFDVSSLGSQKMCYGIWSLPLRMEMFNFKLAGPHTFKGRVDFTAESITEGQRELVLEDPEKKRCAGKVEILKWVFLPQFFLIDYFRGGLNLDITCFMSFGEEGENDEFSEHRVSNMKENNYFKIISSVYNVLSRYQKDLNVIFELTLDFAYRSRW